ncbi:unnamed protein product, partial [Meganyctiphanes norvegica]
THQNREDVSQPPVPYRGCFPAATTHREDVIQPLRPTASNTSTVIHSCFPGKMKMTWNHMCPSYTVWTCFDCYMNTYGHHVTTTSVSCEHHHDLTPKLIQSKPTGT